MTGLLYPILNIIYGSLQIPYYIKISYKAMRGIGAFSFIINFFDYIKWILLKKLMAKII